MSSEAALGLIIQHANELSYVRLMLNRLLELGCIEMHRFLAIYILNE